VIGLIKAKARRWARRFPDRDGDVDDLVQEGRCALLAALPGYDPEVRPLNVYIGSVLDRCYARILRDALTQKRNPHVWEVDPETGDRHRVPAPTVPVWEVEVDDGRDLEADVDHSRRVRWTLMKLIECLNPLERRVLECYVSPPADLIRTAANLTDRRGITAGHVALYLGVTRTKVEHAVRKIRREGTAFARFAAEE
jgi:RNA polymerase sigma factor (sigma-70 family)